MREYLLATALLSGWTFVAIAAPAPEKKEEVRPVEIDFSPVPEKAVGDNALNYELHFVIQSKDGQTYKHSFTVKGGAFSAELLRELVSTSLDESDWSVMKLDKKKLIVKGYKGSPVKTVEVTAERLEEGFIPTTRRIKDEDKKDGGKKE